MDVQATAPARRTPAVDVSRQGPVKPSVGISRHDVAADHHCLALQAGHGLEGGARDTSEASPDGVGVDIGRTHGSRDKRRAEGRQSELIIDSWLMGSGGGRFWKGGP